MPSRRASDSRSLSGDVHQDVGSDNYSEDEETHTAQNGNAGTSSKPGRKKNPNTQAARRDQNRIAQREFRLRKQQRIRDLEAKVELLSGTKEETFTQLRAIVKELMTENHTLRKLVKELSSFIGEGMGGFLPRMGWNQEEFQDFVNRAETDTAYEAFTNRKAAQAVAQAAQASQPQASTSAVTNKRPAPDPDASRKRQKIGGAEDPSTPSSQPDPQFQSNTPSLYTPTSDPLSFNILDVPFSSGGSTATHPAFAQPTGHPYSAARTNSSQDLFDATFVPQYAAATIPATSSSSYIPPSNTVPGAAPAAPAAAAPAIQTDTTSRREDWSEVPSGAKKAEAGKLIMLHMNNYKRDPTYTLPPSFRPTLVQRTIAHDGIIDGIPMPELRDRMILLKTRFDLAECISDFFHETTIHGDDVLNHLNWELDEKWLRKYSFLVEPTLLAASNRWRVERGEPELTAEILEASTA